MYRCVNITEEGICTGQLSPCMHGSLPFIEIGSNMQYGSLSCSECGSEYPVIDFVPLLVPKPFFYLRHNFSIIETYLAHTRRPLPTSVKKSLYAVFLNMMNRPNEPVIPNRKGYEERFIDGVYTRFKSYFESQAGMEWEPGIFCLGDIRNNESPQLYPVIMDMIKKYHEPGSENAVDIACNLGGFTFMLSSLYKNSFGFDTSFEAIHSASLSADKKQIAFSHGSFTINKNLDFLKKPNFFVSEAETTPFISDYIDLALALNIVDIVPDPVKLLKEIARITRKNGTVIITTPFVDSSKSVTRLKKIAGSEIEALKIISEEQGFSILEEKDDILWRLNEYKRKIVLYNLYLIVLKKN